MTYAEFVEQMFELAEVKFWRDWKDGTIDNMPPSGSINEHGEITLND